MKTIELTTWFEPSFLIDTLFDYIAEQEDTELLEQIVVNLSTELRCWDKENTTVEKLKKGLIQSISD